LAHRFPEQVPEKTLSFYLRFPIFNTAIKTRFWKNSQKMPKMIFLNSFAGPFPEQDPVKTPSLYLILLLLKACGMLKKKFLPKPSQLHWGPQIPSVPRGEVAEGPRAHTRSRGSHRRGSNMLKWMIITKFKLTTRT